MPDERAETISSSQAAWNDFTEQLRRIGDKITGPTGARNARERAEGYRYLLRLVSAAHALEAEADRRHPVLTRMMTPIRKFKGDGTDTLYHEAKLDDALPYEFTVRRGDHLFFSATVYAYDERGAYYIVDNLIDEKIEWEADARSGQPVAHIHLSAQRPAGVRNWIALKGARPILFTRQYFPEFVDSTDQGRYAPALMTIRCLSAVGEPGALSEQDLAESLQRVIAFVEDATDVSIGLSIFAGLNLVSYERSRAGETIDVTQITDGRMHLDDTRHDDYTPEQLAAMVDPKLIANNLPGPGIQYLGAWFKLSDDEAIKITGKDVPCRYWSCQILTRYLESGDYRFHKVGLNNRQVKLADDGSFTIYASHQNPGVDNWVCTQGYENAHILIRTLLADPLMQASFSVVKLSEI
ncbi:MAG TPA: DUF1214 domain-containing protein [Myxococcota bacterium]|nr:DUF1214 domain-containing protein [Myxococcota bacterium]